MGEQRVYIYRVPHVKGTFNERQAEKGKRRNEIRESLKNG